MQRNTRAILPFVPAGRLSLGATLFRAAEQATELRELPFLGWERWLEEPIEVVDVEGDHVGVFLGARCRYDRPGSGRPEHGGAAV